DVEMPRMDGITFLEKLMKSHPIPVIILSTLTPAGCETAIRALDLGAIEVIHKPELDLSYKLNEMIEQLADKIEGAALAKNNIKMLSGRKKGKSLVNASAMIRTTDKVVAIGASTGGTEALREVLPELPANFPGIVLTLHMPANFTKSYANSLNSQCAIEVKEAQDNDTVRPGLCLLAPGNYHMLLHRSGARYFVNVKDGPLIHHQRPAVDILFESVAKYAGSNAIGVILTGMGKDGAAGLLKMKEAGAVTIGQDEDSCVVYGMPKVAFEMGAVERVKHLNDIPGEMVKLVA
ncbi:MAG: chemotaxis response regulator protein-glutamate methylesterase, partial [Candidatus Omnitrophica bacterium]|nr:chemotaxis response regulator protein-glutamate methylesterase [Candidatus Omnitrophota bacterium]